MTEQKQRKIRTYTYSHAEHQRAVGDRKRLADIKEAIKPVNAILRKLRMDRLIKK